MIIHVNELTSQKKREGRDYCYIIGVRQVQYNFKEITR